MLLTLFEGLSEANNSLDLYYRKVGILRLDAGCFLLLLSNTSIFILMYTLHPSKY